jgi:hypothetical protein
MCPILVNTDSATATSQLTDKEGMMYWDTQDSLCLVPTPEVLVTTFVRDEFLKKNTGLHPGKVPWLYRFLLWLIHGIHFCVLYLIATFDMLAKIFEFRQWTNRKQPFRLLF